MFEQAKVNQKRAIVQARTNYVAPGMILKFAFIAVLGVASFALLPKAHSEVVQFVHDDIGGIKLLNPNANSPQYQGFDPTTSPLLNNSVGQLNPSLDLSSSLTNNKPPYDQFDDPFSPNDPNYLKYQSGQKDYFSTLDNYLKQNKDYKNPYTQEPKQERPNQIVEIHQDPVNPLR